MNYIEIKPILDRKMMVMCCFPYPGHRAGCPNFDKKEGCPPKTPMLDEILDISKPVFAIYNIFDLKSHVDRMREKHPNWTDRQLRCLLYWQPKARKDLRGKIRSFLALYPHLKIIACPEANGVNVTETMSNAGITLEWMPVNVAYQIVFAGSLK